MMSFKGAAGRALGAGGRRKVGEVGWGIEGNETRSTSSGRKGRREREDAERFFVFGFFFRLLRSFLKKTMLTTSSRARSERREAEERCVATRPEGFQNGSPEGFASRTGRADLSAPRSSARELIEEQRKVGIEIKIVRKHEEPRREGCSEEERGRSQGQEGTSTRLRAKDPPTSWPIE